MHLQAAHPADFVIDAERRIPAICLKCGAHQRIVRRNERLASASSSQGLGIVGGVGGVIAAHSLQNDRTFGMVVMGGMLAGAVVLGLVIHARTPFIRAALPLCRTCNARWEAGLRARHALLGALVVAAGVAGLGFLQSAPTLYVAAAILFAGAITAALALRLRTRFIHAAYVKGSHAVLRGVCEAARAELVARAASADSAGSPTPRAQSSRKATRAARKPAGVARKAM